MRFQATVLAFAATLAMTSAQSQPDLSGIPSCALPCFVSALPKSGCGATDIKCQCTTGRDAIQAEVQKCSVEKCSQDDLAKLTSAVAKLCQSGGVTLSNVPSVSTPAAASASGSSAAGSSAPAASTPAASGTSARASTSPRPTGNAAANNAVGFGAIALGFAAVFGL
ncbi:hypothetical protein ACJQWK_04695 [Exserohilum turcicum]|uniref:CFEM domain-containing protein n=1 Tax=Exserohilum turcicum (strain 28A) TaxID=671987 RepID=R0IC24_EXST2|nr:uncharacterized protein SETTUDRAFT_165307 [Exserohilum turcica Et28A]EOA82950.1 hypothetical protein SETTUDRAFT_165307 [Exserohilum turcica Et28A]